ncbi:MAG: DNA mismatch repair protein [Ignavibacteria bacterium RBG_13_36_8]|nr:MAG: DNA mismatch repair protein [Ignavibacteria bacterium RBG_13_36_8]
MSVSKIKILPENLINKIAAGEVVQRPASVVKELMENSIDAEAKNIEVFVKRAGSVLIQIVDDGCGMSEEDAVLSVQRHSTSKISSLEDLGKIRTLGFRGEALSSIASVSNFEMRTETTEDEIGTLIRAENDIIIKEKGSFPKGTSIAVKNLFYNTPARRNFLKSHATELKHIIETFKRIALSHPQINFKLWNDDELIFEYSSGSLDDRMKSVFAENILDVVIKIEEVTDYISLNGYVAKPTYLIKSRGDQYFYLNDRFVLNRVFNHAVFTSFENILEKGDYPFFVLFLDIDPSHVDVNVHPAKLEVKFEDEKDIYSFVHAVIKKGLGSYDLVPNITFGEGDTDREKLKYGTYKKVDKDDFADRPAFSKPFQRRRSEIFSEEEIDLLFSSLNPEIKENAPRSDVQHPFEGRGLREVEHETSANESVGHVATFIVSLHNKYILSQIKSGLMIIDQHVAHERILYEKALTAFNTDIPFSQQLLFSQSIQTDPADYELLKEIESYLTKLGFELKFFSKNTVVIVGVPPDIKVGSEVETLLDILNEYKINEREKKLEIRDNLAKSFSCKAAIKAGDRLSEREMRLLVDQLFATSMPYICPHGRPIVIKIPLDELDKRFGRT